MKTESKYEIPVKQENIRLINDPTHTTDGRYFAQVKISDLPVNLPTDINPRNPHLHSKVSRDIRSTLLNDPAKFPLLNKGATIIANKISYDVSREILTILLDDPKKTGVIDGGSSYAIIKREIEKFQESKNETNGDTKIPGFLDSYFMLEILSGLDSDLGFLLAKSRNTSIAVAQFSLANYSGEFNLIKKALRTEEFYDDISWTENEEGKKISVLKVVSLLTLFHPLFSEQEPIIAYSGRAKTLNFYLEPENEVGYKSLNPISGDILRLHDYIIAKFPDWYSHSGGLSKITGTVKRDDRHNKFAVRFSKIKAVRTNELGYELDFSKEKVEYAIPNSWIYPFLAALRELVVYGEKTGHWKTNPYEFLDQHGPVLVKIVMLWNKKTPNSNLLGKEAGFWSNLRNAVSKLINAPVEKSENHEVVMA